MTENEAKEMLQAKLTCMKLEDLACIEKGCSRNCDDCEHNYAQGTRGEQEEAIKIAIGVFEEIEKVVERKQRKHFFSKKYKHFFN